MTMPRNPDAFSGERPTRGAKPRPRNSRAALRDRLTQGGQQPQPIPDQVIGALALYQGLGAQLVARMEHLERSPILFSGIVRLVPDSTTPAVGVYTHTWQLAYQCVSIANISGSTVTAVAGGVGDPSAPPISGAGVHKVPTGVSGRFGMNGNALTIYGVAGTFVDLQVASRWLDGL